MATPTQPLYEPADVKASSGELSLEELQCLRLCRNRAYAKANDRRRRHVSVSMAAFMQREWRLLRPQSKCTGKELIQLYKVHFEKKSGNNKALSVGSKRPLEEGGKSDDLETLECKKAKSDIPHIHNEEHPTLLGKLVFSNTTTNAGSTALATVTNTTEATAAVTTTSTVSSGCSHIVTKEGEAVADERKKSIISTESSLKRRGTALKTSSKKFSNNSPHSCSSTSKKNETIGLSEDKLFLSTKNKASFRHWTSRMMLDLLSLSSDLQSAHCDLQPGSVEYNDLLLKKFQAVHPACIESRRSLYLKLQTLHKDVSEGKASRMSSLSNTTNPVEPKKRKSVYNKRKLSNTLCSKSGLVIKSEEPEPKDDMKPTTCNSNCSFQEKCEDMPGDEEPKSKIIHENSEHLTGTAQSINLKGNINASTNNNELADDVKVQTLLPSETGPSRDDAVSSQSKSLGGVQSSKNASNIEGFESWSLQMIRDFIACMDTARKRFAILKQRCEDNGSKLRLVPLVHEEWLRLHPESDETVRSVLIKIKLLKSQKDVIKEQLRADNSPSGEENAAIEEKTLVESSPSSLTLDDTKREKTPSSSGSSPTLGSKGHRSKSSLSSPSEFKWQRDMIHDVVKTRQKALVLRREQQRQQEGAGRSSGQRKISFHNLWEQLFREKYPNSHFTANNLSVHFWSWRKQQQRMGLEDPILDQSLKFSSISQTKQTRQQQPCDSHLSPGLMTDLSQLVQRLRSKGVNIENKNDNRLLNAWRRMHPKRTSDTVHSLLKVIEDNGLKQGRLALALAKGTVIKWTPRHNLMLRKCAKISDFEYKNTILAWRQHFPRSSLKDKTLRRRLDDLRLQSKNDAKEEDKEMKEEDRVRDKHKARVASNARGQMQWSDHNIDDLIRAHSIATKLRRHLLVSFSAMNSESRRSVPSLSQLFQAEFLRLHPHCRLSSSVLLKKYYAFKAARQQRISDNQETDSVDSRLKDLIMESRQRALLGRRQEIGGRGEKNDPSLVPLLSSFVSVWLREFNELGDPESTCHTSSMTPLQLVDAYASLKHRLSNAPSISSLKKDVFLHMKNIVEGSKVYLPSYLSARRQRQEVAQEQQMVSRHMPPFLPSLKPSVSSQRQAKSCSGPKEAVSGVPDNAIKLPGGATLMAVAMGKDEREKGLQLFRSKANEKPHVTITLGSGAEETMKNPLLAQPLLRGVTVPPPMATLVSKTNTATPPPLPQLRPYGLDPHRFLHSMKNRACSQVYRQLPKRVVDKMHEYGLNELLFDALIQAYNEALIVYEKSLCSGHLVFFPYLLQSVWSTRREEKDGGHTHDHDRNVAGRRLAYIMEVYAQEVDAVPACLLKSNESEKPETCRSEFTEDLIRDLITLRQEIVSDLCENETLSVTSMDAIVDSELHRRWHDHHEVRLSYNHIVGISRTLKFEGEGKGDFSYQSEMLNLDLESKLVLIWSQMNELVKDTLSSTDPRILRKEASEAQVVLLEPLKLADVTLQGDRHGKDHSTLPTLELQQLFHRCRLLPERLRRRPNFQSNGRSRVLNVSRFWTERRLERLLHCCSQALDRRRRSLRRHKWGKTSKKRSLMTLLKLYWKRNEKLSESQPDMAASVLLAKVVRHVRWARREGTKRLDKRLNVWRAIVDEYEISHRLTNVTVEELDHEEADDDDSESEIAEADTVLKLSSLSAYDFSLDSDVLALISDSQRSATMKLPVSIGWRAELLHDLIKARRRARGRKRRWEQTAVEEYGSLGIAYSNTAVKVDKMDDLFVEEWGKIRPKLAHLSIWTLNAHARRFDMLKKALMEGSYSRTSAWQSNNSSHGMRIQYWDNSGIPIFNLETLQNENCLKKDVLSLVQSRQKAMTKQHSSNKHTFLETWKEEYNGTNVGREVKSGYELARRLHCYEYDQSTADILFEHVVKVRNPKRDLGASGILSHEEALHPLRPRQSVFDDESEQVGIRCQLHAGQMCDDSNADHYLDFRVRRSHRSALPMLVEQEDRNDEDEEEIKFSSKLSQLLKHTEDHYVVKEDDNMIKEMGRGVSRKVAFNNINNHIFHEAIVKDNRSGD